MLGVMGLFLLMNTTHVTSSCKGTSTNCGLNKLYIDTHYMVYQYVLDSLMNELG